MNDRMSDRSNPERHFKYLREIAGEHNARTVAEQLRDLLDRLQQSDTCVKVAFKATKRRRKSHRKGLQQLLRDFRAAKTKCDVITYPELARIRRIG